MPAKSDIKKQLEAVFGHPISEDAVQFIGLFHSVASYTFSDGFTTQQSFIVPLPNRCYQTRFLDVSGFATTGIDGKSLFRLTSFLCPAGERFLHPINVVATPFSSTPCFLTVVHSLLNNGDDVEIKVSTWDANGAPAPNVSFNWRCRVELQIIIL